MTPKPARTFEQQLEILIARGLQVGDRDAALQHLGFANYFRLSGYHHPFLDRQGAHFLPDVGFATVWELYRFDHRLRLHLMDAIERCEIAFRTRWAYELAHRYDPQAYENAQLFRVAKIHSSTLSKIDTEIERSHEDFLQPYRKGTRPGRPPIWMACEVMSLGALSNSVRNLRLAADRTAIARPFGLDEGVFTSFLHHLTTVRNFCAHHSRLWNRKFTVTFQLPRSKPKALAGVLNPSTDRQLYNTLAVLAYLLNRIEPGNHWRENLRALLAQAPLDAPPHMGFPNNWQELPLWA